MIGGLHTVDRASSEIHECGSAVEMAHPLTNRSRVPNSMSPASTVVRSVTRHHHDLPTQIRKMSGKILPEKPRSSGDHNTPPRRHFIVRGVCMIWPKRVQYIVIRYEKFGIKSVMIKMETP